MTSVHGLLHTLAKMYSRPYLFFVPRYIIEAIENKLGNLVDRI
jgi:hypothetical protein